EILPGQRTRRLPSDVERGDVLRMHRATTPPCSDVGSDLVAGIADENDDGVGGGVAPAHAELGERRDRAVLLTGPAGGHPPIDAPQSITGSKDGDVVELAAVADAAGVVGTGHALQA